MNCNTLTLIELKRYGEKISDYIERMKLYFNTNIKNQVYEFEGYKVYLIFHDDCDPDRTWKKLAVGDEKGHNFTSKVDHRRLPYLPVLNYVMNNINSCSTCEKFKIEKIPKTNRYRVLFKCMKNWYKIVLSKNENQDFYYLIAAYVDSRLKKEKSNS